MRAPSSPRRIASPFLLVLMVTPLLMVAGAMTSPAYGLEVGGAITEWSIPTAESLPASLALDPSGSCCWFVESSGNKVAHLDPSTDTFREWTIPTPDSNPKGLALTMVSDSLVVFGTESAKNKVFIFFPETGQFREYTLPEGSGPNQISIEPGGSQVRAWFTELTRNAVGQIIYDPVAQTARLYEVTLPAAAGGGANGVYARSEDVWFAGKSAIVKLERTANQFTTWAIPSHTLTEAAFISVGSLSQVWYTSGNPWETSSNYVGVLRTDNTFTEWQVPTIGADLEGISISPVTDNPWVAEQGADKILKLDPSTGGVVTSSRPTITRPDTTTIAAFTHIAGPVRPSAHTVLREARTIDGSISDEFTEWALLGGSRPNNVVVDSSGEAWILESGANKVTRLSLAPDFVVECDPSSLTVIQSNNGTSTCTVTSIDGFTSTVELAASWVGAEPTGLAYTLDTPVTPPPGRGTTSTLIISAGATASPGTRTLQVTATSGSLSHTADITVTIGTGAADFAVTISPSYLTVIPGGSATSTITTQSVGVFFSPVHLTSSGAPDGMSLTFGTNPVTPPIGGTASSILTVSVSGTPTGTYTVTITGTSGSLARDIMLTVEVAGGGGCLIATATYGSELSDEVQFLRGFRDNSILRTRTGSSFMTVFNAWYYSFSPTVAQFIREHPAAGTASRFALYPFVGILRIGAAVFYLFPTNVEIGAVASGLVVSSLIGLVYLTPPLTLVLAYSTRTRRVAKRLQMPAVAVLLGALAAVVLITVLAGPAVVMMAGTSTVVLASVIASALFASRVILRIAGRR